MSSETSDWNPLWPKTLGLLAGLAPADKAWTTQQWLAMNVPEFIKALDWPSGRPDLNPLNYRLRSHLEGMACHRGHTNLESFKSALVKAVNNFPHEVVHTAIDD